MSVFAYQYSHGGVANSLKSYETLVKYFIANLRQWNNFENKLMFDEVINL